MDAPAQGPGARKAALPMMRKRREFLAAARARRQSAEGLMLQARRRDEGEGDPDSVRVGFTCSKKVGNAVKRNRAKRRLRAAAAAILPEAGRAGWDYVLIGRAEATANRPFAALLEDLRGAVARIHAPRARP